MAQDRLGTATNVLTQCRQNSVAWIAVSIVTNVSQSVGMQASPFCNHCKPSVLELFADEFKCKHDCEKCCVGVLTSYAPSSYSVNTARTDPLTVQRTEIDMELIHQEGFYKVYAAKTGAYVTVWSSDYPSKYSLLGTCETRDEALDLAFTYTDCMINEVAF